MSTHKHTTNTTPKKKGVSGAHTTKNAVDNIRYPFSYHQCFHRFHPTVSNTTMHQGSPLPKNNEKKKQISTTQKWQHRCTPLPSLNNVPVLDNFLPFMYNCRRPNCASSLIMVNSCKHNNNNRGTCGKHQTSNSKFPKKNKTTNTFSTTTNQNEEHWTWNTIFLP
jgi:hypothetical protein